MADDPRDDFERRLRKVFEPAPGAAVRVRDGALAAHQRRSGGWRPAMAGAAALTALAAALVFWRGQGAPTPSAGTEALAATLSEGLVILQLPDGSTSITGGPAREGRTPEGYGFVLVEGELR
jgi:hypothetical protein